MSGRRDLWGGRFAAGPAEVLRRFNDSWSQALGIGTGSAAWRQHAYTFVAEDSNIDVRIVSENTGTAHIDDLVLTPGRCKVPNGVVANGAAAR